MLHVKGRYKSHLFLQKRIPSKLIYFQTLKQVQVCSKKTGVFFWQIHVKHTEYDGAKYLVL